MQFPKIPGKRSWKKKKTTNLLSQLKHAKMIDHYVMHVYRDTNNLHVLMCIKGEASPIICRLGEWKMILET